MYIYIYTRINVWWFGRGNFGSAGDDFNDGGFWNHSGALKHLTWAGPSTPPWLMWKGTRWYQWFLDLIFIAQLLGYPILNHVHIIHIYICISCMQHPVIWLNSQELPSPLFGPDRAGKFLAFKGISVKSLQYLNKLSFKLSLNHIVNFNINHPLVGNNKNRLMLMLHSCPSFSYMFYKIARWSLQYRRFEQKTYHWHEDQQ